jgi:hypothetical protein
MDPRQKLADAVWLDDVVVRAELEPHHPVDLLAPRADDDDRHAGALSKPPADLQAVQAAAPAAASSTSIASRTAALDRAEVAPRKALAQKPPKLPALPAKAPAGAALPAPQPAQRVMYVRPAPRIVTIHRHGAEQESDDEAEGGGHDRGGFDD